MGSEQLHVTARCGTARVPLWKDVTDPSVDVCVDPEAAFYPRVDDQRVAGQRTLGEWYHSTPEESLLGVALLVVFALLLGWLFVTRRPSRATILSRLGSTRGVGLMRIGTALLLWSRFAGELLPLNHRHRQAGQAAPLGQSLIALTFYPATAAMLVGWHSRLATAVSAATALSLYYWMGVAQHVEPYTHHHTNLLAMSTFLVALTPCGGSYSIDRYLVVSRARAKAQPPPPEQGDLWALPLMVLQLSMVYFFAAWSKTDLAFVRGDRLEQLLLYFYTGSEHPFPVVGASGGAEGSLLAAIRVAFQASLCLTAVAVLLVEYTLAVAVWCGGSVRRIMLPIGALVHALMYITLPVYTLSAQMWVLYLCWFDPADLYKVTQVLHGGNNDETESNSSGNSPALVPDQQRQRKGSGGGGKRKAERKEEDRPEAVVTTPRVTTPRVPLGVFSASCLVVLAGVAVALFSQGRDLSFGGLARSARLALQGGSGPLQGFPVDGQRAGLSDELEWTGHRNDLQRSGFANVTAPMAVTEKWRIRGFNKGTHSASKGGAIMVRTPAGKLLLVVGADTGALFAYGMDGEVEWASATWPSANGIHGTACLIGELVVVGAYDGALYAFDVSNGTLAWRAGVGQYIGSSPLCDAATGRVLVSVEFDGPPASGRVGAVDAATGRILSTFDGLGGHSHSSVAIDPRPTAAGNTKRILLVGANDGVVYGLDSEHLGLKWKFRSGGAVKAPIAVGRVRTPPSKAAAGSWLSVGVFGSWDQNIYALDTSTGELVWTFKTRDKVMSGAAVDEEAGLVFVGSHDHHMYAINGSTGLLVWSYQTENIIMSSPTVTRNLVVFGSSDGHVYALYKKTGFIAWRHIRGRTGQISSTPLVAYGHVVYTSRSYQHGDHCWGKCVIAGDLHVLVGTPGSRSENANMQGGELCVGADCEALPATAEEASSYALPPIPTLQQSQP